MALDAGFSVRGAILAACHNFVAFLQSRFTRNAVAYLNERTVTLLADDEGAVQASDARVERMEAYLLERLLALYCINLLAFGTARDQLTTLLALVAVASIHKAIASAARARHSFFFEASLPHVIVANAFADGVGLPAKVSAAICAQSRLLVHRGNILIALVAFRDGVALAAMRIALMTARLAC